MKKPEKVVVDEIREYLKNLKDKLSKTDKRVLYKIETEYEIQMGSYKGKADVVLRKTFYGERVVKNPLIIVECKALGNKGNGIAQLKSYLCARDSRFGIFAVGTQQGNWKYYENLGGNEFKVLPSRKDFEEKVIRQENLEVDKEQETEKRINQAIKRRSQRFESEYETKKQKLIDEYEKKEADLQAEKEEADLQAEKKKADLQSRLSDERHREFWAGFWKGFWVGVIVSAIVIAIIASGS